MSIDGGGTRGYLPALVLQELERRAKRPASDLFDLIVGTSTGGIIGIGLAAGRSATELAQFYPRYGRAIFGGSDTRPRWKQRLFGTTGDFARDWESSLRKIGSPFGGDPGGGGNARHSADGLDAALGEVLGEMTLAQVSTPLIATTFDAASGVPVLLTSRDAAKSADRDLPLRLVARATSAAPTFFPPLETTWAGATRRFIDGGVWANNPAHLGMLEAITSASADPRSVTLVSLGTGAAPTRPSFQLDLSWISAAMDTVALATTVHTGHTLCQRYLSPDRYHRLQVTDPGIAGAMDDPSAERLAALASAANRLIADHSDHLDRVLQQLIVS
ncbi:patatin-like phospholipase family protein [Mycolicibacterium rufum]|uniref:Patatin-like phospholipase family protein n=1 Tax=Mycolicibacterium rufum TaxID=318424 RepID=A0ABY3UHA2_9MYCO|nr:patatin-like phospholipase family protein [Mycolicibacterium rufum]ULP37566.1 patatin-like phospholipase family protein [Mycolicibacterium rufum]